MRGLIIFCFVISWTVIFCNDILKSEGDFDFDDNVSDLEKLVKLLEEEEELLKINGPPDKIFFGDSKMEVTGETTTPKNDETKSTETETTTPKNEETKSTETETTTPKNEETKSTETETTTPKNEETKSTETEPTTPKKEELSSTTTVIPKDYACQSNDCPSPSTRCVPKGATDFYCICNTGYKLKEGNNKDTNKEACTSECDKKPCQHEGKCITKENGYDCNCTPFYEGNVCQTATCGKNPCKNGGECKIDNGIASCNCKPESDYDGDTCERHKWCINNNICKQDETAECKFDEKVKAGYCKCNDANKRFDYQDKKCKGAPECLKTKCENFDVCNLESGKCECLPGYERDASTTKCTIQLRCKNNNGDCFKGSECSETGVKCHCNSTYYYYGRDNQCLDSKCIRKNKTDCGCPSGLEKKDGTCRQLKGDNKEEIIPCTADCGIYGYCYKKEEKGEDTCACITEIAENNNNNDTEKCVLKSSVCPLGVQLTENKLKCNCIGKFKMSTDGITCQRKTCLDKDAQEDCAKLNAICDDAWGNNEGYECKCEDGYQKDANGKCIDKCSVLRNKATCSKNNKVCFLNEVGNNVCQCPPGLTIDSSDQCVSDSNKDKTYIVKNLPVVRKRYLKNSAIDVISLTKDIFKAMKKTFDDNFNNAYLYTFSINGDILSCSVKLELKDKADFVHKRIQLQVFDDGLLSPSLFLNKEKISEIKEDKLYLCSGLPNDPFCGNTVCEKDKCECPSGYKPVDSSIKEFDVGGQQLTIFTCEDINECITGTHKCPPTSTNCVNTDGSFFCRCLPKYKTPKEIVSDTENKGACVDVCQDPNPCNSGKCTAQEDGLFDCSCPEGKSGSFCNKDDLALAGATKKTAVVGAVLGVLLGVVIIGFVVYVLRQRNSSYSEDFSPPPRMQNVDNSEMVERRPMRGVTNRAYQ